MSKSKGEFLTVSLLEEKGFNPISYRLFCLKSHYRNQLVLNEGLGDTVKGIFDAIVSFIGTIIGKIRDIAGKVINFFTKGSSNSNSNKKNYSYYTNIVKKSTN